MHAADPLVRRAVLLALLALALLAGSFFVWVQLSVAGVHDDAYEQMVETYFRLKTSLAVLAAISTIGCLVLAVVLLRFAQRCRSAGRFPHPQARTFQDIPIAEGSEAVSRYQRVRLLGIASLLLAVAIPIGLALIWQHLV